MVFHEHTRVNRLHEAERETERERSASVLCRDIWQRLAVAVVCTLGGVGLGRAGP